MEMAFSLMVYLGQNVQTIEIYSGHYFYRQPKKEKDVIMHKIIGFIINSILLMVKMERSMQAMSVRRMRDCLDCC